MRWVREQALGGSGEGATASVLRRPSPLPTAVRCAEKRCELHPGASSQVVGSGEGVGWRITG